MSQINNETAGPTLKYPPIRQFPGVTEENDEVPWSLQVP